MKSSTGSPPPATPLLSDKSDARSTAQESTVSSLADSEVAADVEADGCASPPPDSPDSLISVGTEERMTMVEDISRARSLKTSNRKVLPRDSGDGQQQQQQQQQQHHGGIGRPPLSPQTISKKQTVNSIPDNNQNDPASMATSNSGKYMSPEEISLKHEEDSFYSAPANEAGDDNIWGLLSGVMGNVYEW